MVNLEVINNLWLEIDKLHLSHLQTEESPERIQQKRKLKGFMKEYLCLVTSNQRFYSPTTKEVLYTSILKKGDKFSSSKFSHAWEMLGMYAANLLGQPWRKEFKEIRLYSGGYKYEIEHQLLGAEDILMEMGYTLDIEYNRLIVQGILDYDRIVRCHRDCLLAQVESEILGEIHSTLNSSLKPCKWGTIFEYRDKYVGSVNHCVRGLMYQQAQKETMYYPYNPQPPPLAQLAPYLGPHEMYPMAFPYPVMYQQPYPKPSYSYMSPVPLREVNKNLAHNTSTLEEPSFRSHAVHDTLAKSKQLDKPIAEQFDLLDSASACDMKGIPKFEDLLDIERLERLIYDDVDSNKKASQEPLSRDKRETELTYERAIIHSLTKRVETKDSIEKASLKPEEVLQGESIYNKKPGRLSPNPSVAATTARTENMPHKKQTKLLSSPLSAEREQDVLRRREVKETPIAVKVDKWECLFCTFCNTDDREICEMCSKSKNSGPEIQPLQRGGRECSNCTLVNPPDEKICAACSSSLTDAPTYI